MASKERFDFAHGDDHSIKPGAKRIANVIDWPVAVTAQCPPAPKDGRGLQPAQDDSSPSLLTVKEVAGRLKLSESWVRRHLAELRVIRVGRLLRFDPELISTQFRSTIETGNSLKPERKCMSRYQRGSVVARGRKGKKVWYGKFREDVLTPDGTLRKQRLVRLGTISEFPTKNSARNKLAEIMGSSDRATVMDMTFGELAERWEKAEGPTKKSSSMIHYQNAIRMYVKPVFGERKIAGITREGIQIFLAEKAKKYSRSALKSMRTVLSMTLGWAADCGWLPNNPCTRIKLPRETGGKHITRALLKPEQIASLCAKLEEPYSTLVWLIAATGLRIGEAIAIQWEDINKDGVLSVSRRIYVGDSDEVKSLSSVRRLPLDPALLDRVRSLKAKFPKGDWVFQSTSGTTINPGNAMKRYIHPAAKNLGIRLGGYHDFRHTLCTNLRRSGTHPKVVSGILGHKKVNLAMDVYDRVGVEDFAAPLSAVVKELVSSGIKSETAA